MINSFVASKIRDNFGFAPTEEQSAAIDLMGEFLSSREGMELFLLRGYAGTGKTSLVGALVKTLVQLSQPVVLMAPTGRAAKVFSSYAGQPAYTIHKRIYRQRSITDTETFSLNVNLSKHTLFIVDEASMISNEGLSSSTFGTGRLLDDLIQYVYSGEGCRLMLLGDTAQLPPVGEEESPALMPSLLESYGLRVYEKTLTQVMRQLSESGILYNATAIRCQLMKMMVESGKFVQASPPVDDNFQFSIFNCQFPDVAHVTGADLIDSLESSYSRWGADDCMIICRSNKRANIYNLGIRNRILYREEELCSGDRIMIVKNNYYWVEQELRAEMAQMKEQGLSGIPALPLSFIANGDIAVVRRVRRTREMYGFRFADVLLRFPDYDDYEMEATVLLDTLQSESPSLTREESERLFQSVMDDYAHITTKKERYEQLRLDPHFNALQIKYAYAITCHKAQGGQWGCIYLDQGYLSPDLSPIDHHRWLYTAFTRATEQVYLVNFPLGDKGR
ncbi:MAG: AAA family ATPase [Bacteroidaceae bacterium]|nr:AAA family ATPase [Bacteroidaceae bacterium]